MTPARRRTWTIATGVTGLFGAVAACASFGTDPPAPTPPPTTSSSSGDATVDEPILPAVCDETRLADDALNCGRCRRSCLGAKCVAGECQLIEVAKGLDAPGYIRAHGNDLFVVTATSVVRFPKAGGAVVALADDLEGPEGLAVDDAFVYCATAKGVVKTDRNGVRQPNLNDTPMTEVAVSGGDAFCCFAEADQDVVRFEALTGKSIKLGKTRDCHSIAPDVSEVFFGGEQLLRSTPDAGVKGIEYHPAPARRIAMDAEAVYSISSNENVVLKRSRITKPGASDNVTLTTFEEKIADADIAVFEGEVYWTTGGAGGSVYHAKTAVLGVEPQRIAKGLASPKGIAVDEYAIYWTEPGSGRVVKRAR